MNHQCVELGRLLQTNLYPDAALTITFPDLARTALMNLVVSLGDETIEASIDLGHTIHTPPSLRNFAKHIMETINKKFSYNPFRFDEICKQDYEAHHGRLPSRQDFPNLYEKRYIRDDPALGNNYFGESLSVPWGLAWSPPPAVAGCIGSLFPNIDVDEICDNFYKSLDPSRDIEEYKVEYLKMQDWHFENYGIRLPLWKEFKDSIP